MEITNYPSKTLSRKTFDNISIFELESRPNSTNSQNNQNNSIEINPQEFIIEQSTNPNIPIKSLVDLES